MTHIALIPGQKEGGADILASAVVPLKLGAVGSPAWRWPERAARRRAEAPQRWARAEGGGAAAGGSGSGRFEMYLSILIAVFQLHLTASLLVLHSASVQPRSIDGLL